MCVCESVCVPSTLYIAVSSAQQPSYVTNLQMETHKLHLEGKMNVWEGCVGRRERTNSEGRGWIVPLEVNAY